MGAVAIPQRYFRVDPLSQARGRQACHKGTDTDYYVGITEFKPDDLLLREHQGALDDLRARLTALSYRHTENHRVYQILGVYFDVEKEEYGVVYREEDRREPRVTYVRQWDGPNGFSERMEAVCETIF